MDNDEKKMIPENGDNEEKEELSVIPETGTEEAKAEEDNADDSNSSDAEEDECTSCENSNGQNNRMKILLGILLCAVAAFLIWKVWQPAETTAVPVAMTTDFNTAVAEWLKGDAAKGYGMIKAHADQGLPQAQFYVAIANLEGRGTARNIPEAILWAEKVVDKQPQAYAIICPAYLGFFGNEFSNQAKAFEWSQKAMRSGLADGCFYSAVCYMNGIGCPQNTNEALRLMGVAAASGHSQARMILTNLYSIGPRIAVKL